MVGFRDVPAYVQHWFGIVTLDAPANCHQRIDHIAEQSAVATGALADCVQNGRTRDGVLTSGLAIVIDYIDHILLSEGVRLFDAAMKEALRSLVKLVERPILRIRNGFIGLW